VRSVPHTTLDVVKALDAAGIRCTLQASFVDGATLTFDQDALDRLATQVTGPTPEEWDAFNHDAVSLQEELTGYQERHLKLQQRVEQLEERLAKVRDAVAA